jgi:SAM-dependent methyltransferase
MTADFFNIPKASPQRILALRESAFAADLFIAAVSHFDFFNRLDKSPADAATICASLGIQKRPADVMLTLFKAYGLIREKGGKYYLSDISRHYLLDKSGFDLSSYVASLQDRPICRDMVRVMQTGRPANWAAAEKGKDWAASMEDSAFADSFTAGMNSRGAYLARGLLKAVDFQGYHHLLDIGGGSGIYAMVLLQDNPHLSAAILEKPPVDRVSSYSVNKYHLGHRIEVIPGDMFRDRLPGGYDVHLLSHVLHDWDFPEVRTVIKNSYASLSPGGKIIIHDAHVNRKKTGPLSVAEYSVLLMFLSEGKCYSTKEMEDVLKETGFRNIEFRPTIYNRSIVAGIK